MPDNTNDANMQSPEMGGPVPGGVQEGPPAWQGRSGKRGRSPLHGVVTGFLIVLVGLLFLLQNLDLLYIGQLWQFWPVILIGVGLSRLVTSYHQGGRVWGAFVAGLGVVFLLSNMGLLPRHAWNYIWPLALIFWGLMMAFFPRHRFPHMYPKPGRRRSRDGEPWNRGVSDTASAQAGGFKTTTSDAANRLNEYAIMGGIKRRVDSQEFEGGEATAVMGGIELDLSRAGTKLDEVMIEANAFMGGVEIRVPQNWEVTVQGMGILGGYADATRPFAPAPGGTKRPHLIVTGQAMFGGVQVKN